MLGKISSGWRVQARTIRALVTRDVIMRYGRANIGFVWAIVEPMILCLGVMGIWSVMGGAKNGVKMVELVLTGYMPLTLWRHAIGGCTRIFRASTSLLYHRQITLLDIVVSRFGLEFIGSTAALIVVWGTLNAAGVVGDIARLDLFLLGWFMMAWIGFGFGALIAAITELSETSERFIAPIQYLNIPLSGAFFFVDWLPTWSQKLILIHPHAHCYEVFRHGFFGDGIEYHYDVGYFSAVAFVVMVLGVWSVTKVRSRVALS